jgi:hypothetical protein
MRIEIKQALVFRLQRIPQREQEGVLPNVGKIAGVKSVTITKQSFLAILNTEMQAPATGNPAQAR